MLVFLTRYVDLFFSFISLYNSVMKVIFIVTSVLIVYIMKFKHPYCATYDKTKDTFFLPFLLVPCVILALLVNEYFSFSEVALSFLSFLFYLTHFRFCGLSLFIWRR